jgi:CDP-diglyceride synthetase
MFGLGIFEILVLVAAVGGFIIWLHPELLTTSGYSGCLIPKKLGMATLRIVVWMILLALTMPGPSDRLSTTDARGTLGMMLGAAFLTWILFRLRQVFREIRGKLGN